MNVGLAGYVWRCVERENREGFGYIGEDVRAIYERTVSLGEDRATTLYLSADRCLEVVNIALESPGGNLRGRDTLESAYEYVASDVLQLEFSGESDEKILRKMFFLGVAVRDVEKLAGPT